MTKTAMAAGCLFLVVASCDSEDEQQMPPAVCEGGLSTASAALARALGPLPASLPPDGTNRWADHPGAAAVGQRLFFDASYSGALATGDDGKNGALGSAGERGKISCASCHLGPSQDDQR